MNKLGVNFSLQEERQQISRRSYALAAFVCVVAALVIFLTKTAPRLPYADEFEYLGYALGLYKFGVFGQVVDPAIAPQASMFFPPVIPYFYAFFMYLSDTFVQTFECALQHTQPGATGSFTTDGSVCTPQYGPVLYVQAMLSGLTIFFVWACAARISGSVKIASFAAVLALLTKDSYQYANYFLTENITLFLSAAFGWSLLCVWQEKTVKRALICAVVFGFLVLTRAGWNYALLVIVPVFLLMAGLKWKKQGLSAFLPLGVFVVGFTVILSPWLVRNWVTFDKSALTASYGDKILSHRLPYNRMTGDEMLAAYVYWLPDFGDDLAAKLFSKESYERLDFGSKNGFYQGTRYDMLRDIDEKRGSQDRYSYMLEHEVLGNLGKHVAVTMAMVWRGMFIGKYWGLVAWCFALPLLLVALYRRWGDVLVLALPPIFMMGLSAFVSVSIPRYNIDLIPFLAFATAYVLSMGALRIKRWWGNK